MTSIESVVKEMEAEMENHFSESKTTVNEYNKGLHSGIYSYIGSLLPKLKSISPQGASEGMAEALRKDIFRLDELRRFHIEPYNLGEMGEVSKIISRLSKLASLSPGVEDNQTKC